MGVAPIGKKHRTLLGGGRYGTLFKKTMNRSFKIANYYVVFDVETTGLRLWRNDRIIEIGAVAIVGEDMTEEFHTLIEANKPMTKAAQKIHGITR